MRKKRIDEKGAMGNFQACCNHEVYEELGYR